MIIDTNDSGDILLTFPEDEVDAVPMTTGEMTYTVLLDADDIAQIVRQQFFPDKSPEYLSLNELIGVLQLFEEREEEKNVQSS